MAGCRPWTENPNDQARGPGLVARISPSVNQRGAGEALFERYYSGIYRFFCNKVNDDVADLVQQTFTACVEGRDRLRQSESFRSYLFAVAHNVLRAHLRARYRGPETELESVSARDLSPGPSSLVVHRRE